MEYKICSKCKEVKQISEFYKRSDRPFGYRSQCKKCTLNKQKEHRKKNPEKYKQISNRSYRPMTGRQRTLRKYNLTIEEYDKILREQKNTCKICGGLNNGSVLYVDHNHKTGKIRGLLCRECNFSLGGFKDNSFILIKAIEYLKNGKNQIRKV